MIYKKIQGTEVSALGLGNMRLPKISDNGDAIDYKKAHEIIDYAYHNGITYFDTAYVYNSGDSEKCVGEAMKKFDRNTFYLATKFYIGANPDYKAVFEEQLQRLQTDHIDFYLIHCLTDGNIDQYLQSGAIEYFLQKKEEGKISYLGFSSHASVATLERFADHHAWDFAQLQINYYDWYFGSAAKEYEVLASRNIPLVVMEPVRGGRLSQLTPDAEALLKAAHPDWSTSSWALRFVKSLPNVRVILSGMSSMPQIIENMETFGTADSLSEEDQAVLKKTAELFKDALLPCTGCRYCTADCPMQINIPEFLKVANNYRIYGASALEKAAGIETTGQPSDCIGCGSCMNHCPQGLKIPELLEDLAALL